MLRTTVIILLALSGVPAGADTVAIGADRSMNAQDGLGGVPPDGYPDRAWSSPTLQVVKVMPPDGTEWRGVVEFVLPPELVQPGVTINHVWAQLPYDGRVRSGVGPVLVHGYAHLASDDLTPEFFGTTDAVASARITWSSGDTLTTFELPLWLQSMPSAGLDRIGLVFATDTDKAIILYGSQTQLFVDYSVATGTPPTIYLTQPDEGTTYTEGQDIALLASANDAEDGELNSRIVWLEAGNPAQIAAGAAAMVRLSAGTHVLLAQVRDSDGNVATRLRTVGVAAAPNTPPTIAITAPADGSTLSMQDPATHFKATAFDEQQGSLDASIEWWMDDDYLLGKGAELVTILPISEHTVSARVADNHGATAEASITVDSQPPVYCNARGSSTRNEWIKTVFFGVPSTTGANGYMQYATPIFQGVAGNTRDIVLTPGYSAGAYTEQWGVWIDLNHDGQFSSNELLASGIASSTVTRPLAIPATAKNGPTTMRVVMRNGGPATACGAPSRGEVEDYTINITGGVSPPAATAYCSSRGLSSNLLYIDSVAANGTRFTTGKNDGFYSNLEQATFTLLRGATNHLEIAGPKFSQYGSVTAQWAAWVDLNHNLDFSPDERVLFGTAPDVFAGDFAIPMSALTGPTRLRVQVNPYTPLFSACQTFDGGETEDYTITIPR
jgi:hypothetical protein